LSMSATCPSAPCKEGALLLGIVLADGRVAFAQDRMVVDKAFVEHATAAGSHPPETRFRFGSPCARGACHQWTGSRCGVIDAVLDEIQSQAIVPGNDTLDAELPGCAIRPTCRWFEQSGAAACHVCDLVVTDTRRSAP
jgi:hypothetical protein